MFVLLMKSVHPISFIKYKTAYKQRNNNREIILLILCFNYTFTRCSLYVSMSYKQYEIHYFYKLHIVSSFNQYNGIKIQQICPTVNLIQSLATSTHKYFYLCPLRRESMSLVLSNSKYHFHIACEKNIKCMNINIDTMKENLYIIIQIKYLHQIHRNHT